MKKLLALKNSTEINFCNLSAAEQYKSFLVQQFFKNAAEGLLK
jgi:hypothetical protein